jgi:hypothetical protein
VGVATRSVRAARAARRVDDREQQRVHAAVGASRRGGVGGRERNRAGELVERCGTVLNRERGDGEQVAAPGGLDLGVHRRPRPVERGDGLLAATCVVELAVVQRGRAAADALSLGTGRPERALVEWLRADPALLVLDSCEHLPAEVASSHALIRDALRASLTAPRRARLHARIGMAMERVHAGALAEVAPEIAFHLGQAAGADPRYGRRAVEQLRVAGRRAAEQLSFPEAIEHLRHARNLLDAEDHRRRAELLMELATAEFRAGRHLAALASYDEAVDAAESGGDADQLARAALGYEDMSWRPGRHGAAATERLTRALTRLEPLATSRRAELLGALTRSKAMHGDRAGSRRPSPKPAR